MPPTLHQTGCGGVIKQRMEERPQGDLVPAATKTRTPNLDILHVVEGMQFRVNPQGSVIEMRGGFGISK